MMRLSLMSLFLLIACAPPEARKIEPYDEYVLVEFAAKLEEEKETFKKLEEKK